MVARSQGLPDSTKQHPTGIQLLSQKRILDPDDDESPSRQTSSLPTRAAESAVQLPGDNSRVSLFMTYTTGDGLYHLVIQRTPNRLAGKPYVTQGQFIDA
ncbi:hypothetical protein GB937_007037 [Aspergillus fischeri]|nr:hypothetical protein GB937_007037 [Aspergillus fischeri]